MNPPPPPPIQMRAPIFFLLLLTIPFLTYAEERTVLPDDYADAIEKVEKEIGSSEGDVTVVDPRMHEPHKFHKHADGDEPARYRRSKTDNGYSGKPEKRLERQAAREAEQNESKEKYDAHLLQMLNIINEKLEDESLSEEERSRHLQTKEKIEKNMGMTDDEIKARVSALL